MMLQALKRLHAIDPDDGELHHMLVDFVLAGELFANLSNTHSLPPSHTVEAGRGSLPGPVVQVISETLPRLTGGLELTELNQRFLDKHHNSLSHLVPGKIFMLSSQIFH